MPWKNTSSIRRCVYVRWIQNCLCWPQAKHILPMRSCTQAEQWTLNKTPPGWSSKVEIILPTERIFNCTTREARHWATLAAAASHRGTKCQGIRWGLKKCQDCWASTLVRFSIRAIDKQFCIKLNRHRNYLFYAMAIGYMFPLRF